MVRIDLSLSLSVSLTNAESLRYHLTLATLQLSHPNLLPVLELVLDLDLALISPYCKGKSLASLASEEHPFAEDCCAYMCREVCN